MNLPNIWPARAKLSQLPQHWVSLTPEEQSWGVLQIFLKERWNIWEDMNDHGWGVAHPCTSLPWVEAWSTTAHELWEVGWNRWMTRVARYPQELPWVEKVWTTPLTGWGNHVDVLPDSESWYVRWVKSWAGSPHPSLWSALAQWDRLLRERMPTHSKQFWRTLPHLACTLSQGLPVATAWYVSPHVHKALWQSPSGYLCRTPLMMAVLHKRWDMALVVLEWVGYDPLARDKNGHTALQMLLEEQEHAWIEAKEKLPSLLSWKVFLNMLGSPAALEQHTGKTSRSMTFRERLVTRNPLLLAHVEKAFLEQATLDCSSPLLPLESKKRL